METGRYVERGGSEEQDRAAFLPVSFSNYLQPDFYTLVGTICLSLLWKKETMVSFCWVREDYFAVWMYYNATSDFARQSS